MNSWRQLPLGEVLELKRGYDLPQKDRRKGTVPIVSSSGVSGWHDEHMVRGPGVVTGRYGTIGEVFYVPTDFWPLNTALYVRDFKGNDPRYISYLLKTLDFNAYSDKGAVPGVNRNHLHRAIVCVPSVDEQRRIAELLSSLDNKIEQNYCLIQTAETIAQVVFKSWFENFEPVIAKCQNEPVASISKRLGLAPELLELFPANLVDTELGPIPDSWKVESMDDLCERVAMGPFGSDIKTDNFVPEGVPIIRGGNLKNGFSGGKFVYLTEEKATELSKANAYPGDIVLTHRGTLGQVGLIPEDAAYPRYVVSQSQMVVSVKPSRTTSRYIYEYLRSHKGQNALLANTSQVGVPAIARPTSSVKALRLVHPPLQLLQAFDSVMAPIFAAASEKIRESNTLAETRDALLPRLLSGELKAIHGE